jgi:hypothetical protein
MPKYTIEVSRHYVYQIEVDATDEMAAYQEGRNWEIEDLEPYETKAWFDTDVISVKEAN